IMRLIKNFSRTDAMVLVGSVAFVFLWMAAWRGVDPVRYDTGLYHIQLVNWIINYPVVTGLGNFHERLAYPQSCFLYLTYLEQAYWKIGGYYLCSYVLVANVLLEWLLGARNIVIKSNFQAVNVFRLLLILPLMFYHCYDSRIVTASPDVAVFLLELVMMV